MFPGNGPNYGGPRVWWISVHFRGRIGGAIIYFNPSDSRSIAIFKVCPLHGLMVNLEAQTSRHLQLKFWAPNLGDSSRYFCSRIVTKIHVWLSALQKRGTCPTERINKKCAQIMKRVFWRFYLVSHLSSGLIDSWKPVVTKTTKNKKKSQPKRRRTRATTRGRFLGGEARTRSRGTTRLPAPCGEP